MLQGCSRRSRRGRRLWPQDGKCELYAGSVQTCDCHSKKTCESAAHQPGEPRGPRQEFARSPLVFKAQTCKKDACASAWTWCYLGFMEGCCDATGTTLCWTSSAARAGAHTPTQNSCTSSWKRLQLASKLPERRAACSQSALQQVLLAGMQLLALAQSPLVVRALGADHPVSLKVKKVGSSKSCRMAAWVAQRLPVV